MYHQPKLYQITAWQLADLHPTGFEPGPSAWEALVLPLHQSNTYKIVLHLYLNAHVLFINDIRDKNHRTVEPSEGEKLMRRRLPSSH